MKNAMHVWQPAKFLVIATELLNRSFLEANRADAKRLFREIETGQSRPLVRLRMEDDSELLVKLALDVSEFIGRINFRIFRQSLEQTLKAVATRLASKEQDLNIFSDPKTGELVFLLPGIVAVEGQVNVLVLGAADRANGELVIKLQYLEPSQFIREASEAVEPA